MSVQAQRTELGAGDTQVNRTTGPLTSQTSLPLASNCFFKNPVWIIYQTLKPSQLCIELVTNHPSSVMRLLLFLFPFYR